LTADQQAIGAPSVEDDHYGGIDEQRGSIGEGIVPMTQSSTRPDGRGDVQSPRDPGEAEASEPVSANRWERLKGEWERRLQPGEQSVLIAWSSFTATFAGVRALTHWIRDGHGPSGGGMSVGGHHFHHYNLGIAGLAGIGAVALRGHERHRRHPLTAVAYGSAVALVVDELALLIDLKDVYWAKEGRTSVDAAIIVTAVGATIAAGLPFWPHARHALRT
jgi:hypothetical protein